MARYADDSKEKVRDAVDMVDLVETRTELRRAGTGRYMGCCPFHDERTPSFSVDAERKLYHCFGCGVGGDAIAFVQETEGLDFVGALESLASRYGVELEVADEDPQAAERRRRRERLLELLERAASFYVRWLWDSAEAAPARAYLTERGLEEETLRAFRVGYAPSAWDTLLMSGQRQGFGSQDLFDAGLALRARKGEGRVYDRFRRRIMFPLADPKGRALGFGARALSADAQPKYLNSPESELFHKGDQLYAADLARVAATRADRVVVAEGYMDVLMLHQAGLHNTVGIMGTSVTERQVGELAKLGSTVLLALDADSAGQEAMLRAARMAAGRKLELRVVVLPGGLDPADLVAQQGAAAAHEAVEASIPFVRFRVERELEAGDLDDAEGKDRVIDALRPVFGTLAPSALREELLAHVADRLDLAPSLVSSLLAMGAPAATAAPAAPSRPSSMVPGGSRGPAPVAIRPRADAIVQAEKALLAQCVATPEAGEEILARLDDAIFSGDGIRRVVVHLRGHLRAPEDGLPDDDAPLRRAVAALLADASQRSSSRVVLQRELAWLELKHKEQQMRSAAASGGGVAAMRTELDRAKLRWEELVGQSLAEAPAER